MQSLVISMLTWIWTTPCLQMRNRQLTLWSVYCGNVAEIDPKIILCMHPANERRRYNVTSSLFAWAHTLNDPYCPHYNSTECTWFCADMYMLLWYTTSIQCTRLKYYDYIKQYIKVYSHMYIYTSILTVWHTEGYIYDTNSVLYHTSIDVICLDMSRFHRGAPLFIMY